jgi:hypothetical protein
MIRVYLCHREKEDNKKNKNKIKINIVIKQYYLLPTQDIFTPFQILQTKQPSSGD